MVLATALLSACGSSGSKTPVDAAADAPPDAPALRTVSGTMTIRYHTTSGEMDIPQDLSAAQVFALVPPSFTAIPGVTTANGTFSIANVPAGPFYLVLGTRFIVMSADTVDLSFDHFGRPGTGYATAPTDLTFDVTGMSAWQGSDQIEMSCAGSGTVAFEMQANASAGAPAAGDTSLNGFTYDLSHADAPALLDATAGDQLVITHLANRSDGTHPYQTIAESFSPAPFSISNAGAQTLSGAFSPVTASSTLALSWDRPAFASELASHSPGSAAPNWSTLAVTALPDASTRGFYAAAPDVVVFAPGYLTDATAVTTSWPYADPYPAAWCNGAG